MDPKTLGNNVLTGFFWGIGFTIAFVLIQAVFRVIVG
jgi:hypothetical protein